MIRALLVDADGVLQHVPKGFLNDFAALGGGWSFVREVFGEEQRTMTGSEDLVEVLEEVIDRRGLAISPEQLLALWYRITPDQRMLDLVARVRQAGAVTVLATNQQSYRGTWMQQNLPYDDYFDHTFYSFEMGLAKPDPAYFASIVDHLDIDADQAVFVDDLAKNTAGARKAGLKAITYPPRFPFRLLQLRLRTVGVPGV
ncbi:MAG TPA: HAD-IA family hydrolase [Propionicimonas sp.]|nr:HAD-IA family hydrolase [Propionicimonas sp.]